MFAELFPIIEEANSLLLRVQLDQQDPSKLQVFVTAQHQNGDKYPALNQTIMLSNTPELLDQEFCAAFTAYAPQYVAASTGIKDSLAQLAANTEAAKKAVTKHSTKADPAKPNSAAPKPVQKPTPDPAPQVSLFAGLDKIGSEGADASVVAAGVNGDVDVDGEDQGGSAVQFFSEPGPSGPRPDLLSTATSDATPLDANGQGEGLPTNALAQVPSMTTTAPTALFQTI